MAYSVLSALESRRILALVRATVLVTLMGCILLPNVIAAPLQVSVGQIKRIVNLPSQFVPSRPIDIWLPDGYDTSQRYAVLYMHDGQMLFDASQTWNGQSWQVAETAMQLQQSGQVRPFIVVGIHNIGAARHSEYFPQKPFARLPLETQQALYAAKRAPGVPIFATKVYSDHYLQFLVTELKPYIDQHFATDSRAEATFIAGSSMGGLISWYAQAEYPHIFGGAASLSTHWPGTFSLENNPIPLAFIHYLQQHLPTPSSDNKWYFDHGDQTLDALYPALQQHVDAVFRAKGFTAEQWHSRAYPGTDHSEAAWAARLATPLTFLLAPVTTSAPMLAPTSASAPATFKKDTP